MHLLSPCAAHSAQGSQSAHTAQPQPEQQRRRQQSPAALLHEVCSTVGSSQHRQRANAASPPAQRVRPSDVRHGQERHRASAERNTSPASSCQTIAVGATRCQLELFSMKRASTHQ